MVWSLISLPNIVVVHMFWVMGLLLLSCYKQGEGLRDKTRSCWSEKCRHLVLKFCWSSRTLVMSAQHCCTCINWTVNLLSCSHNILLLNYMIFYCMGHLFHKLQCKMKSCYLKKPYILDMYLIHTEIFPHKEVAALHGGSNLQNPTQIQDHH